MKKILLLLALVSILSLGSCTTVLKGTNQDVTFNSEPQGATVVIDGETMGRTPVTITLRKRKYDTVTISKEGYETQTRPLSRSYDPVAVLNVFWDSSTTDLITGAAFEYDPSSYYFQLQEVE